MTPRLESVQRILVMLGIQRPAGSLPVDEEGLARERFETWSGVTDADWLWVWEGAAAVEYASNSPIWDVSMTHERWVLFRRNGD